MDAEDSQADAKVETRMLCFIPDFRSLCDASNPGAMLHVLNRAITVIPSNAEHQNAYRAQVSWSAILQKCGCVFTTEELGWIGKHFATGLYKISPHLTTSV